MITNTISLNRQTPYKFVSSLSFLPWWRYKASFLFLILLAIKSHSYNALLMGAYYTKMPVHNKIQNLIVKQLEEFHIGSALDQYKSCFPVKNRKRSIAIRATSKAIFTDPNKVHFLCELWSSFIQVNRKSSPMWGQACFGTQLPCAFSKKGSGWVQLWTEKKPNPVG